MRRVLVASALAHLAVFAWLARTPAAPKASASAPALEDMSIEMEVAETPVPTAAPAPVPESAAVAAAVTASPRAMGGGPAVAAPAIAPASSAGVEPIAGANTDWVVNLGPGIEGRGVPGTLGNGALGGPNPFLTRPPEAPSPTAKRKDTTLKDALLAQDAAKGLGPDGPVLRALEEETRTSLAPIRGNATFRAIVDAGGNVTALQLLDASSDHAGWNDARERAFAALQKKKLELRGASGARIDIRVESEMRYPDGSTARAQLGGPGGSVLSGDLSNIGSGASRVVHARVSRVTPL